MEYIGNHKPKRRRALAAVVVGLLWAAPVLAETPPAKPKRPAAATAKAKRATPPPESPGTATPAATPAAPAADLDLPLDLTPFDDMALPPPEEAEPAPPVPAKLLRVGLLAGVALPTAVLGAGPSFVALFELRPAIDVPLTVHASVGFERHTALAARRFPAPAGGYDVAARENQNVLPILAGVAWEAWRGGPSVLSVGASAGLLGVWTAASALGSTRAESGVGGHFSLDVGFAHELGPVELRVQAALGLRRSAVGPRTRVIELPWYPVASLAIGAAYPF